MLLNLLPFHPRDEAPPEGQPSQENNPYGYVPTRWICIMFVTLYAITTVVHLGQALRYRLWFLLVTVCVGGAAEVIGWSGRLWSSSSPQLLDPYLMQITTTIIAPTPFLAAIFMILGEVVIRLSTEYSRLSPTWYSVVFISADIVALVIQSVGGAKASTAAQNNEDAEPGGRIMLGGIAIQMASITFFVAFATEFIIRYHLDRPVHTRSTSKAAAAPLTRRIKLLLFGVGLSIVVLFIRTIYRTIELTDGWSGRIISTQVYFNVLDGAMVLIAFYCVNIFHPGVLLGRGPWVKQRPEQEPEIASKASMQEL